MKVKAIKLHSYGGKTYSQGAVYDIPSANDLLIMKHVGAVVDYKEPVKPEPKPEPKAEKPKKKSKYLTRAMKAEK